MLKIFLIFFIKFNFFELLKIIDFRRHGIRNNNFKCDNEYLLQYNIHDLTSKGVDKIIKEAKTFENKYKYFLNEKIIINLYNRKLQRNIESNKYFIKNLKIKKNYRSNPEIILKEKESRNDKKTSKSIIFEKINNKKLENVYNNFKRMILNKYSNSEVKNLSFIKLINYIIILKSNEQEILLNNTEYEFLLILRSYLFFNNIRDYFYTLKYDFEFFFNFILKKLEIDDKKELLLINGNEGNMNYVIYLLIGKKKLIDLLEYQILYYEKNKKIDNNKNYFKLIDFSESIVFELHSKSIKILYEDKVIFNDEINKLRQLLLNSNN